MSDKRTVQVALTVPQARALLGACVERDMALEDQQSRDPGRAGDASESLRATTERRTLHRAWSAIGDALAVAGESR